MPWVPLLYDNNIYGHMFVNGGNSVLLSGQRKKPAQLLSDFRSTFRWSAVRGRAVMTGGKNPLTTSVLVDQDMPFSLPDAVLTPH